METNPQYYIEHVKVTDDNISQMAKIHIASFKNFFLTSLGYDFLKTFYKAIARHPKGISLGVFLSDEMIGFAVGSSQSNGFYSDLLRQNIFSFALGLAKPILSNPMNILKLLNGFKGSKNYDTIDQRPVTLLSICIDPSFQGVSLGKNILESFEHEAIKRNGSSITLSTNRDDNQGVNGFYIRNGYKVISTYSKGDSGIMNLYKKSLETHGK